MKSDKPLKILFEDFLSDSDIMPVSIKGYRSSLELFSRWMIREKINVRAPRRADLIRYKIEMLKTRKVSSVNFHLSVIRLFFKWLDDNGIYDNIAAGIKNEKRTSFKSHDYLTEEQAAYLLSVIDSNTISGLRDYAMINLMIRTGIRRVEVNRLNIEDITENPPSIRILRKGRAEKVTFGVSIESIEPVIRYLSLRSKVSSTAPLFVSHSYNGMNKRLADGTISKLVKSYMKKIGLNTSAYTAHSLRHTAASLAVKAGSNILQVSALLGHSKIVTTQLYIQALNEQIMAANPAIHAIDRYINEALKRYRDLSENEAISHRT